MDCIPAALCRLNGGAESLHDSLYFNVKGNGNVDLYSTYT